MGQESDRSRKLLFVIPGSGRGKEEGTAESRQERGDAGGGLLDSHCLFWAVPLYVKVKSEPGPERFHDKLVVDVPAGQMI